MIKLMKKLVRATPSESLLQYIKRFDDYGCKLNESCYKIYKTELLCITICLERRFKNKTKKAVTTVQLYIILHSFIDRGLNKCQQCFRACVLEHGLLLNRYMVMLKAISYIIETEGRC